MFDCRNISKVFMFGILCDTKRHCGAPGITVDRASEFELEVQDSNPANQPLWWWGSILINKPYVWLDGDVIIIENTSNTLLK